MTAQFIKLLILALISVESSGDPNAQGDWDGKEYKAIGILQIHPVFLADVNRILGVEKYKLDDRWNPEKSKAMVRVWFRHYSKYWSNEKCIRWYNAGGSWQCEAAERYYKKTMKLMKGVKK